MARGNVHPIVIGMATGMGLLTDKYMLAVTNFVDELSVHMHATDFEKEFVKAAMYAGAVLGMITFGPLSDYVGRRVCLIACSAITMAGAIGSTISPNYTVLIAFRILTGLGMGGEYPLAATHSADSGDENSGGRNVALLYLFGSGLGQASCPLIVYILLKAGLHNDTVWRTTFGIGAAFATLGLVLRIMVTQDSTRFKEAQKKREENDIPPWAGLAALPLAGTAFCWFLYDIVEYGLKQNDAAIFRSNGDEASSALTVFLTRLLVIPSLVAATVLPKYVAIKWMQLAGFVGCALVNLLLCINYAELRQGSVIVFDTLYIIQLSFQSLPGVTTMAIPAEIFPSAYKGTAHGFSAAMGKVGATIGSYLFALLKDQGKIRSIFGAVFATSILGGLMTLACIPSYNGRTLVLMEELASRGEDSAAVKMLYSGPHRDGGKALCGEDSDGSQTEASDEEG